MAKYWTGKPKQVEGALVPQFGCYVFTEARSMAICQAFGRSEEEAHTEATCIIAAMVAVETKPAVAAKARHYLVRSPKFEGAVTGRWEGKAPKIAGQLEPYSSEQFKAEHMHIMAAPRADADLLDAYDRYFEGREARNQIPLSFDEWKAGNRG